MGPRHSDDAPRRLSERTWRHIKRDVLIAAVLAVAVGLFTFAILLGPQTEWTVMTKAAVASGLALLMFALTSVLFALAEYLWGL